MGYDIIPLASRMLMERMRRSPEQYYAAHTISLDNQAFFITERRLTVLFDEFQLSSMVSGVISLELRRENIHAVTISPYHLLSSDHAYNLMMVPLREVTQQLGYVAHRNSINRNLEIWDMSAVPPQLVAWMITNTNEYHTQDMTRSLEAAPYLNNDGRTYVPITFFEQILPLTVYIIDPFGYITFLAYRG
jgi:hypothetical protein